MIWVVLKTLLCASLLIKLILYLTTARCKSKVCLVDKIALITGGNSGLGLAIAKELASRGCTIIIADKDDTKNTINQLIKETHNPNISAKIVDFTSFRSVRLFAEELKQQEKKLNVLINNIGTGDLGFENTEDGIQKIMQVNYFSHFLLTHLLMELLLVSGEGKIIYTSSLLAYFSHMLESDLKSLSSSNKILPDLGSYCNSKLAGAIMSRILSVKLKNTSVTSNVFHPGLVNTNIYYSWKPQKNLLSLGPQIINYLFGKSPEEGVQTLLHLACSNEAKNKTGEFFMECTPVWQPKQVYDINFCKKIWKLSEEYVKLKPEEKLDTIIQQWQTENSKI